MFEVLLLLTFSGVILWAILSQGRQRKPRRTPFINLAAELKPAKKSVHKPHLKH